MLKCTKFTMITLIALTVFATATSEDAENDWNAFKKIYKKSYASEKEENYRKKIYHENQQIIELHNEKYGLGDYTYNIKMNQFGDMTYSEYRWFMGHDRPRKPKNETENPKPKLLGKRFVFEDGVEIPDVVDCREKGEVTQVRDQGLKCGACWAFSTTGALEAQNFQKTGVLTMLSVQQLIDCDYSNNGCGGGSPLKAFQFAKNIGGLESESEYPYEGKKMECPYSSNENEDKKPEFSFVLVDPDDEDALTVAVATVGPISAGMDASHNAFRFYSEGIYIQSDCSNEALDHGVLIVGYGKDSKNGDYWLVKNSFGETWGEDGYFKIARNRDNHCGIASVAAFPIV